MCNHCPFVIHLINKLVSVSLEYEKNNIGFIAINSNDIDYFPEDSPENMKIFAKKNNINFPYLFDKDQSVAKAFNAACTPDFYIFDKDLKCVYRGQFDDSRPGNNKKTTGNDLTNAIDKLLNEENINTYQKPSIGCNIKWK